MLAFFFFFFFSSPATNWIGLRKLQELDISDNKLTELPMVFLHSFKSLSYLNVSRNKLKVFPDAWACPLVSMAPGVTERWAPVSPAPPSGATLGRGSGSPMLEPSSVTQQPAAECPRQVTPPLPERQTTWL